MEAAVKTEYIKSSGAWFKGRFCLTVQSLCLIKFVLRQKRGSEILSTAADKGMRTSRPSCFTRGIVVETERARALSLFASGQMRFQTDSACPTGESACADHNNAFPRKSRLLLLEAGKFAFRSPRHLMRAFITSSDAQISSSFSRFVALLVAVFPWLLGPPLLNIHVACFELIDFGSQEANHSSS